MERTPKNNAPTGSSERESNFNRKVQNWSKASAKKLRMPFPNESIESIDWDVEEYQVTPNDPRWIAPADFDIGAHSWYQELPEEKQIDIGKYRIAQIARVGGEFEAGLIMGMAKLNMSLPSSDPMKRYMLVEAEEEHRHMEMFDKMITQIGVEPAGAPEWFHMTSYFAAPVARYMSVGFMALVLMGEEPIDHMQKKLVAMADSGREIHPMVERVMRIHIAEEARHIGFADGYVEQGFEKLSLANQALFAVAAPILQKRAINTILKPSGKALQDMGVPKQVAKEVWWNSENGQQTLYDVSTSMYKRAKKLGIAEHRLARAAWRNLGHGE